MKYTIKKGKHYNFWHIFLMPFSIMRFKPKMKFTFKLSKECWFKPVETDDFDINKLYGRSFGLHHKNSVRLGWVPINKLGEYVIYLYLYNNGKRKTLVVDRIFCCDEIYTCKVNFWKISGVIELEINGANTVFYSVSVFDFPKLKLGYKLRPYFGGNKTAPQTMTFEINDL